MPVSATSPDATLEATLLAVARANGRVATAARELGVQTFPQHHAGKKLLSWDGQLRTFSGDIPWLSPLALVELLLLRWRLGAMAGQVPPDRPWDAPRAAEWDALTLESWKGRHLHSRGARLFLDSEAALTVMAPLVPVMLLVTVSVAVMVWLPAVRRVALKEPVPLVRVASAGRVGLPSVLVKWTVPA